MAVIGITYEEPTPSKYEFVDISYGKGMKEKKEFKSVRIGDGDKSSGRIL